MHTHLYYYDIHHLDQLIVVNITLTSSLSSLYHCSFGWFSGRTVCEIQCMRQARMLHA